MKSSEAETKGKQEASSVSESMNRYQLGFKRTICIVFLFFKMAVELTLVFTVVSKQTKQGCSRNQLYQTQISTRTLIVCCTIPLILAGFSELICLLNIFFTSSIAVFSRAELRYILEYCRSVLRMCMRNGVWNVKIDDDEEFFLVAFTMLGSLLIEHVNSAATALRENYKPLIQYTYAHKRGLQFIEAYLDASDNIYVQLAAVTILNIWADNDFWAGASHAQPALELPGVLLRKLLDKAQSDSLVRIAAKRALKAQTRRPTSMEEWELLLRDTTKLKGDQYLHQFPSLISPRESLTLGRATLGDDLLSGNARVQALQLPTKEWIFAILKPDSDERKEKVINLMVRLPRSPLGYIGRDIKVFVKVLLNGHATSTAEKHVASSSPEPALEFYFYSDSDMADCVGVGVDMAKVTLYDDLSIIVRQDPFYVERQREAAAFSVRHRQLVMRVAKEEDDHAQAPAASTAQAQDSNLSQFGVSFESPSLYIVEKQLPTTRSNKANAKSRATETVGSWSPLYEMALFILTECQGCNFYSNADAESSSECGARSVINNTVKNLMGRLTKNNGSNMSNRGNREQGAGSGDGDEKISASNPDPGLHPVEFKVTVHTKPSKELFLPLLEERPLDGLVYRSISAKIVFKFRKQGTDRSLCITTHPLFQLDSEIDIPGDRDSFGWYHNNIKISFGCNAEDEARASAWLDPDSCKVLSEKKTSKLTTVRSETSTRSITTTLMGHISAVFAGMVRMGGSANRSQMQQEAANVGQNTEHPFETICEGFRLKNFSGPLEVKFMLQYPLETVDKWNDRDRASLFDSGLLSTITPALEGTWVPTTYAGTSSPYFFRVERWLQLDKRSTADGPRSHTVSTSDIVHLSKRYKQLHDLPFFVNDAMTHVTVSGEKILWGNQARADNVLEVGSVNVPPPI